MLTVIIAPQTSFSIELFPATSAEARKVRKTAAELRYGGDKAQQEALERLGVKRPLRYLLFPGRVQTALSHDGSAKPVRSTADCTRSGFRPAESARPAASGHT